MAAGNVGDSAVVYRWLLEVCRSWLVRRAGGAAVTCEAPPVPCWPMVASMAHFHGVEPILHDCVQADLLRQMAIPNGLRLRWERTYYSTRLKNTEMLDALSRITSACAGKVDVLALKGPAAIATVHGDVGLRPMADLDLLCRRRDLPVLAEIARAEGFSKIGLPILHQIDLYRERDDTLLELHFDAHFVIERRRRFLAGAWRDRMTATVEGWSFPVMSPEYQTVFEVGHCVYDRFEVALKHVVEFAGRLMRDDGPDRRVLARIASRAGVRRELSAFVTALEHLLGFDLGAGVEPRISAAELEAFEEALVRRSMAIGLLEGRARFDGLGGYGFVRTARFARARLFPPLAALQLGYGAGSRLGALRYVPAYAGRYVLDTAARWRSGG